MKNIIKKLLRILLIPLVIGDYMRYRKALAGRNSRFSLTLADAHPQPRDKTIATGYDRHYVYHTSWAARVLAEKMPAKHIDISSSLYFCGIVSAFLPVEFYDYRPADLTLSHLSSKRGDLLALPFASNSVSSLSCMHVVEHIGLGRYGDPIDPDGDLKAAKELARVLAPGGTLLFVVPAGKTALIEWNAHRIYSYQSVLDLFPDLTLTEFSLIPEFSAQGGLLRNASPELLKNEHYACACFCFTKN